MGPIQRPTVSDYLNLNKNFTGIILKKIATLLQEINESWNQRIMKSMC